MANPNINIMTHLLEIAMADGVLDRSEKKIIKALQAKLKISNAEIKNIMDSVKAGISNHSSNISIEDSVTIFYLLVMTSVADGLVQKEELDKLISYGTKLNLDKNQLIQLTKSIELRNNDECIELDNDNEDTAESIIDKFFKKRFPDQYQEASELWSQINSQILNSKFILHNLVSVAMADGNLDKSEEKIIKDFCKQFGIGQKELSKILKRVQNKPGQMVLHGTPIQQLHALKVLVKVAMADGNISEDEIVAIKRYCLLMGMTDIQMAKMENLLSENSKDISRISAFLDSINKTIHSKRQHRQSVQSIKQQTPVSAIDDIDEEESDNTFAGLPRVYWYVLALIMLVLLSIPMIHKIGMSRAKSDIEEVEQLATKAEGYMEQGQIHEALKTYKKVSSMLDNSKLKK